MSAGGPRVASGDMTLFGVYYAVVTQNQDPDKKCRVKVRLPWLDQGDTDQTYWALISTPMAGNQFGWYTLPEVGDTVAVMFVAGDVRQPVVLGGVWSKSDAPPETGGDGKNDFRGYRSRAGARLVLDDSSNGKVYMADGSDKNAVTVGSFSAGGDGPNTRSVTPGESVGGPAASSGVQLVSEDGSIEISTKGKLKVDAQKVQITSKTNVDLLAKGNANFEGGIGNCNGGPALKIEGSSTKIN